MNAGSLVGSAATGIGLMAAAIAVSGFLAHAWPALAGKDEIALRRATVAGGLGGFVAALVLIGVSRVAG
jgi:hypothetical protein